MPMKQITAELKKDVLTKKESLEQAKAQCKNDLLSQSKRDIL
jgi:hypothetical protein